MKFHSGVASLLWCYQIGGGSLRIYKREVQERVLEIVGISLEQVRRLLIDFVI